MIKISFPGLDLNGCREALDGLFVVASSIQGDSFIIVGISVFWIDLYSCWVVSNCIVEFAQLVVCKSSIEQGLEVKWINLQGLAIQLNGLMVVTPLACCVALCMIGLCLLLELVIHVKLLEARWLAQWHWQFWHIACACRGGQLITLLDCRHRFILP